MASIIVAVVAAVLVIWAVGPIHGRHDHDRR
jgi:hypothetical protein